MANPNYAGIQNKTLIKKLNDNLNYIYNYPPEEWPKGAAADYFMDDVWQEVYTLQIELKLRGVSFSADGQWPIESEE